MNPRSFRLCTIGRAPGRQKGVVLFVALIILVSMSLAGIAMIRGVDASNIIAGNLAFKQGATLAGDWGVETARTWLNGNASGSTLYNDATASGYYANWQTNIDLTGTNPSLTDFDWSTAASAGTDAAGNQVSYVIHRLCDLAGSPTSVNCVKGGSSTAATGTKGAVSFGTLALTAPTQSLYRVTARVTGPRNTISYVQVVMN